SERNRCRISQVSSARLQNLVELQRLSPQEALEIEYHWLKLLQCRQNRHAHGRREDVVSGLGQIDVQLRMNGAIGAWLSAEYLEGAIGKYLVYVAVVSSAGTALKWIDDELISPLPAEHFVCGLRDGAGNRALKTPAVAVRQRRRLFDHYSCLYKAGMRL